MVSGTFVLVSAVSYNSNAAAVVAVVAAVTTPSVAASATDDVSLCYLLPAVAVVVKTFVRLSRLRLFFLKDMYLHFT